MVRTWICFCHTDLNNNFYEMLVIGIQLDIPLQEKWKDFCTITHNFFSPSWRHVTPPQLTIAAGWPLPFGAQKKRDPLPYVALTPALRHYMECVSSTCTSENDSWIVVPVFHCQHLQNVTWKQSGKGGIFPVCSHFSLLSSSLFIMIQVQADGNGATAVASPQPTYSAVT